MSKKPTKSTAIKKDREKTILLKEQFIKRFFKASGNISHICQEIKIDRTTYYNWLKKDRQFKEAIDNETEGLLDFVEHKLFNLIDDKNVTAIIFFLKTKAKQRGYYEKTEFVGNFTMDVNARIENVRKAMKKMGYKDK